MIRERQYDYFYDVMYDGDAFPGTMKDAFGRPHSSSDDRIGRTVEGTGTDRPELGRPGDGDTPGDAETSGRGGGSWQVNGVRPGRRRGRGRRSFCPPPEPAGLGIEPGQVVA
jgi:hypothetical protein